MTFIRNSANTGSPTLSLCKTRGTSNGSNTAAQNGDDLGFIAFQGADGTDFVAGAYIYAQVDGTPGANDMPGRLAFSVTQDGQASPSERWRLTNNGTGWMLGETSTLLVQVKAAAGTTHSAFNIRHSATSIVNTGSDSLRIYTNGNVENSNGSYTAISDVKLKENIIDASSQWSDLKAVRIRNWNFKKETGHETHRQIGPIAQELEQVCPGLVFEVPDRDTEGNDLGTTTKGVNQSVLYMKAVKALQEAMERIEALEAKVAALEAS
jgi:hypothetical protein